MTYWASLLLIIASMEPVILGSGGPAWSGEPRSADTALPTLTAKPSLGVAQPYIVPLDGPMDGRATPRSLDEPLPSVRASRGGGNVVDPYIVPNFGERDGQRPRYHLLDETLPAVTSHGAGNLVEPYIVQYNGTSTWQRVDDPLGTVTTRERFALVVPTVDGQALLDISYRMLEPHELAAGQGFPQDYVFKGNKGQVIKQIGNAVTVGLARNLVRAILGGAAGKQRQLDLGRFAA